MATVLDIIKSARRLLNVDATGETPSADEANDALTALNYILDSWNNQDLALYSANNVTGILTANKNPHTVGITGDINIARPLRIERAFTRLFACGSTSPIDFLMDQVTNNRYQEFVLKKSSISYPTHFYYEPSYPLGSLYVYPVQTQTLELHLSVWMQLAKFATINTTIALPLGYENTLIYALAVNLSPTFGKPLTRGDFVYDRAAQLLKEIKAVNQEPRHAVLDSALVSGSRGFNILRGY